MRADLKALAQLLRPHQQTGLLMCVSNFPGLSLLLPWMSFSVKMDKEKPVWLAIEDGLIELMHICACASVPLRWNGDGVIFRKRALCHLR